MEYLKLSLVILLSFEFLCLVSSNPITSLFGKSDDKAEADDKTAVSTASTAKSADGVTTTLEPGSSCGGLKGFLHICEKTATTEPPKSVKTRSVPEKSDSDSDSDSDESKSDEDSDEDKKSRVTAAATSSDDKETTEEKVAKRQADDSDVSETSETTESENIPAPPEVPAPEELPLGLKKRQVNESESSSESESDEEESKRQRRDCRDGPEDKWKDCKK